MIDRTKEFNDGFGTFKNEAAAFKAMIKNSIVQSQVASTSYASEFDSGLIHKLDTFLRMSLNDMVGKNDMYAAISQHLVNEIAFKQQNVNQSLELAMRNQMNGFKIYSDSGEGFMGTGTSNDANFTNP